MSTYQKTDCEMGEKRCNIRKQVVHLMSWLRRNKLRSAVLNAERQ